MAKIVNPKLFSAHFGVPPSSLAAAGLIDPFLNVDTQLFIDPVLLELSSNEIIKNKSVDSFRQHFQKLIRLLTISQAEGDVAWKAARRFVDLREPPANGLGYGGSGRSGSSRSNEIRETILRTCKEIISVGANDPEMISLMGFFEENIGPDTISDLTTTVILENLAEITEKFCLDHKIPTQSTKLSARHKLPVYKKSALKLMPIVLVPEDVVRELPIANDWADIEVAAMENAAIRDRVNSLLAGIVRPTIADKKQALKDAAMGSPSDFNFFLAAVKDNVVNYDKNLDVLGYYYLKYIFANGFPGLKQSAPYDLDLGAPEILKLVNETIAQFKRHVEDGNLWEALWAESSPKKERASQLIYYAIADAFCKANNVDISPEANMGGGPIDFKFSKGYKSRVLVEIKRSMGTVVHGYERQLEFYKAASQTDFAVFVIINYGDVGNKLIEVNRIRNERLGRGERASEIVVIDATRKLSASKRP